jgi:hypothetical protein
MQQLQQKDWIEQQITEKKLYKENQRWADENQDNLARKHNEILTAT